MNFDDAIAAHIKETLNKVRTISLLVCQTDGLEHADGNDEADDTFGRGL